MTKSKPNGIDMILDCIECHVIRADANKRNGFPCTSELGVVASAAEELVKILPEKYSRVLKRISEYASRAAGTEETVETDVPSAPNALNINRRGDIAPEYNKE